VLGECSTKGLWLNDIKYQNENNLNKSNMKQSITNILIWLVRRYQAYCPRIIRKQCRFSPSCSEYMILAVKKYGPLHGACKGVFRICRCLPFCGGEDYP
jgi:putative membrane protein insertion efficiency factor